MEKERKLEDFLERDNNLSLIEPGLAFVNRQEEIESGIIDILAKTPTGEDVVVELKIRPYQSAKVYHQIMKYMNETGNRVVFVAPRIRRDLFFELGEQFKAGRVSFNQVTEIREGEEYVFQPVNETNLPKRGKSKIDWGKIGNGRKENRTSKKIKLFGNEVGEGRVVEERVEADVENSLVKETEDVKRKTPEELRQYPMFYQVMELYDIAPDSRGKYLELIHVSEEQRQRLEVLIRRTQSLDNLIVEGKENKKLANQDSSEDYNFDIHTRNDREAKIINNAWEVGKEFNERFNADMTTVLLEWHKRTLIKDGNTMKILETSQQHIQKSLHNTDNGYSSDARSIQNALKILRRENNSENCSTGSLRYEKVHFRFWGLRILNEFFKQKIKRAKVLEGIDENLANAYLYYSPVSTHGNTIHDEGQSINIKLDCPTMVDFVEQDDRLYQSILSCARTLPLHYRVMQLHRIASGDRDRYLKPISVTREQKDRLNDLVSPSRLEERLEVYDEEWDTNLTGLGVEVQKGIHKPRNQHELKVLEEGHANLASFFAKVLKFTEISFRQLAGYNKIESSLIDLGYIKEKFKGFTDEVEFGKTREAKKIKKMILCMRAMARKTGNQSFMDFVEKRYDFARTKLLATYFDTKYQRAQALEEIDPNLSQAYIRYSTNTEQVLETGNNESPNTPMVAGDYPIATFIGRDTQFYQSILDNLVAPKTIETVVKEVKTSKSNPPSKVIVPKPPKYDPVSDLRQAIMNGRQDRFEGYEAWVGYFVEDIISAGYDDKRLKQFTKNLSGVNLSRRFRREIIVPICVV